MLLWSLKTVFSCDTVKKIGEDTRAFEVYLRDIPEKGLSRVSLPLAILSTYTMVSLSKAI